MPSLYFNDANGLPVHLSVGGTYKPGDPRPSGYIDAQEWHKVQQRAGHRDKRTDCCGKWLYDFEKCECKKQLGRSTLRELKRLDAEVRRQLKKDGLIQ